MVPGEIAICEEFVTVNTGAQLQVFESPQLTVASRTINRSSMGSTLIAGCPSGPLVACVDYAAGSNPALSISIRSLDVEHRHQPLVNSLPLQVVPERLWWHWDAESRVHRIAVYASGRMFYWKANPIQLHSIRGSLPVPLNHVTTALARNPARAAHPPQPFGPHYVDHSGRIATPAQHGPVIAWCDDGTKIAISVTHGILIFGVDAATEQAIVTPDTAVQLSFAPNGERLVGVFPNGAIRIYRTADGSIDRILAEASGACVVRWHPDSRGLAVGYEDGKVEMWDTSAPANGQRPVRTIRNRDALIAKLELLVAQEQWDEYGALLDTLSDMNLGPGQRTRLGKVKGSVRRKADVTLQDAIASMQSSPAKARQSLLLVKQLAPNSDLSRRADNLLRDL
jgi:hypothetical protein